MEIESLAAALEREHHEIDAGIAAFTAAPGDWQPLARAIRALRRHIYLEEEFLFPLLREAEPGSRSSPARTAAWLRSRSLVAVSSVTGRSAARVRMRLRASRTPGSVSSAVYRRRKSSNLAGSC